jgi:hypothetical protein
MGFTQIVKKQNTVVCFTLFYVLEFIVSDQFDKRVGNGPEETCGAVSA